VAEAYYAQALSLPLFPMLSDGEQDHVVATLAQALQA
jgi:dTDP-4-amino-4,6-dideoxygalactose transaminase